MHKPHYPRRVRSVHALGLRNEDVNSVRKAGEPPLVWAADYGTPAVVRRLLRMGADPDARDRQGCTGLHYSAWNDRLRNARLLVAAGADVNAREKDGYTPLMGAGSLAMTHLLLDKGARVNASARDGWTPLMDAVLSGTPEQVALLLTRGADVNARDERGETALLGHMRRWNDHSAAEDLAKLELLLAHGADVNATDGAGLNPLEAIELRLWRNPGAAVAVRRLTEAGAKASPPPGAESPPRQGGR